MSIRVSSKATALRKRKVEAFLYERKKDEDDKSHRLLRAWQANER